MGELSAIKVQLESELSNMKTEVPGLRFKPATSEVEGENSNRYTTKPLMYMQTLFLDITLHWREPYFLDTHHQLI